LTSDPISHPALESTFIYDDMVGKPLKLIKFKELREIATNYNLLINLDETSYSNIWRAVVDFDHTKVITRYTPLKNLSYFSIIECILTHPPRPLDTIDSITRQVSTKLSLLGKRFQRVLEYELQFPSLVEPETVWKKLYDYRSRLAHGSHVDFNKDFKALQSTENIRFFLFETVKLILLYALKDPDFLTDLQKC